MYIDLERDSVIKVRALTTLAAYSVQQTKKRVFSAFAYPRTFKISKKSFKISKKSFKISKIFRNGQFWLASFEYFSYLRSTNYF